MANSLSLSGVYTALITPMDESGIRWDILDKLVERQIKAGISGLIPVGTTGESPTVNTEEHLKLIEHVVSVSAGRVPVIAGTGANATEEALHLTREADKLGADGFLHVAPYYNKPSQEGLYAHFSRIGEITDKPIVLYSIPGRCGIEIAVNTVARLAEAFPHMRTIKEAGGTTERVYAIKAADERIAVLSGDDGLIAPFISAGACGVISVASNLAPANVIEFTNACLEDRFEDAKAIYRKISPLLTDLVFMDGNPVTIKEAMFQAGIIPNVNVRLPLVRTSGANQKKIKELLTSLDLKL